MWCQRGEWGGHGSNNILWKYLSCFWKYLWSFWRPEMCSFINGITMFCSLFSSRNAFRLSNESTSFTHCRHITSFMMNSVIIVGGVYLCPATAYSIRCVSFMKNIELQISSHSSKTLNSTIQCDSEDIRTTVVWLEPTSLHSPEEILFSNDVGHMMIQFRTQWCFRFQLVLTCLSDCSEKRPNCLPAQKTLSCNNKHIQKKIIMKVRMHLVWFAVFCVDEISMNIYCEQHRELLLIFRQ